MGMISYVKQEIEVIRERDPAIKSNMEVFLYPSFKVILSYRVAHKLYLKKHYFWHAGFLREQRVRQGLRSIRVQQLERDFLSIMEQV